ncbi:MAG TPA: multidrug efflux RND transporter permease subunit [Methylomusa anaerophila]|uniref:Efflux pump membrane transporter BepE n=1 Tax=Methylomusa anaerophila TaxID=1930071 RepID=A0A348AG89_9FIRM|nr:multidrug efflux RND transporter permease subunit [Methylomusa anaerophila]BBB90087.1 Efflux pump membrane transporter BepE [Methylomusa anaerophila]HML88188.1 multidrug efflux RND transporter permease subunit [Methylomusa anaerophila]
MAKFFIERPIFAIVLSILITLTGLIAAFNLPVAQYPQIAPPTVRVGANYQGANAEVVEQTVAQTIEEQVNGVEDMVSMDSTSSDAGAYSLSVQFETGKDADIATVQTQNRVSQADASLPDSVRTSGVTTRKATNDFAFIFTLYSENDEYDRSFLKTYGTIYLEDAIKRVKGVGNIMEFGADYAMRIWLQPDKLAQLGVTVSEISNAISSQNKQAPAGTLGMNPAPAGQEFQYTARVEGRLSDPEEFGNIVIRAQKDGSFIRVKDVAQIELGSKDYSVEGFANEHPSAGFVIQLASDANALETVSNVKKVLEESSKQYPPGLKHKVIFDTTEFVRESMSEVVKTFMEALLLVMLVVFLFLQSWRATLIPMLAIPVSLIGTFGAFVALDFSINTLTLFAMVLAIGLVVDDAIVVIEATEHHMRYSGLSPKEATKKAMSEVSGPVVAIAFVLASVFLPVAFFGGTMGILYKQFALTVVVSMALSALVALSLTPALCASILKPYNPDEHKGMVGRFFTGFNTWFENMIERYGRGLGKLIPHGRLCLIFILVLTIGAGFLMKIVPSTFVPDEDQGFIISSLTLPEAASLQRTGRAIAKLRDQVLSQPGVDSAMTIVGYDMLGGGAKSNTATMLIKLKPWDERKTPNTQLKAEIGQIFMKSGGLPEGTVMAFAPPALPGLGMAGGFTLVLEDRSGGTTNEFDALAQKFLAEARKRPEIGAIYTTFRANTPGFQYEVDRDKVQKLGVSIADVYTTLGTYLGGTQVNDFNKFGRTYKVMLQADLGYRADLEATKFFFVKSSSGADIPLDTLLKPKATNAATLITRFNGAKAIKISGNPNNGYSSGQAMTALEEVAAQTLPSGVSYEWSGQSREEKLSGSKAPLVFGFAMLFVFLCLAALYESWSVPFAVLLCVPTGIFGAFMFQHMRLLENSVYMQIGLIMLIGLAAKNAILIVEFAKVRVDKGMDPVQAAIEASKIRLRPILMTSLAFIIGCLPLAIATGAGAAARNSMGTAVVGGMFVATSLGIFLIPVLFVVVEWITAKLKHWRHRPKASEGTAL